MNQTYTPPRVRAALPTALQGWPLLGTLSTAITIAALAITASHHFDVDSIRLVIRVTARISLLLFCLAFTASALYDRWPNSWTLWQRQNRRYLGVSFAFSHAVHAIAIISFAQLDPAQFRQMVNPATFIFGGTAYLFIVAMTATSFDRTAAWLGQRRWRVLHTVGAYDIWLTFLVSEGKRAVADPFYRPFVIVLILVMLIRLLISPRAVGRQAVQQYINAG